MLGLEYWLLFVLVLSGASALGRDLSLASQQTSTRSNEINAPLWSEAKAAGIATRRAQRLEAGEHGANADTLAIVYLLTDLDRKERDRPGMLRVSVQLAKEHIFPWTPSAVYIFTHTNQVELLKTSLGKLLMPNVTVLPINESSWVVPASADDRSEWHSNFTDDYRLMGDWRLSYMPEFVRKMGHRYVLQLDDDSFVLSPVPQNLVALFDDRGYVLGARHIRRDPVEVTWGLPELARYYLIAHKLVPATLFKYCDPPSLDGLYTQLDAEDLDERPSWREFARMKRQGQRPGGGWDRTILFGNCLMYSIEWWFRPEVNRFVKLCRNTGGSFAFRWNEQGVIAMLWQMFVPPENFHLFSFAYAHRKPPEGALQLHDEHQDR